MKEINNRNPYTSDKHRMQCLGTVHSTRIKHAACDRYTTLQEKFQNYVVDNKNVCAQTQWELLS
jgi:hypothetical protein